MKEWWFGYDAAQTAVECSGATHRLLWENGTLHGLDHDDDPEGERTLAALAGERNACVDILDMWSRHQDDLRVLVSASRGPADALAPQEPPPAQAPAAFGSGRPHRVQPPSPEQELITLLALGGRLPDRLAATVAAAWAGRVDDAARPRLHAALWGRATLALRGWLADPALEPDLELIGEDDAPSVTRERIALPFGWLVRVWGRGLMTIAGRFCLAADADDHGLTLLTVGPDFGEQRTVWLEI
jgi:hypothetical protein